MKMEYINKNRKPGLTGLMRVMNDAPTLAQSIDSCIDALDELIITYNDCTDDSPQIIASKKEQYPDKIQVIPYPYRVYGVSLSKEEYEYAKSLPSDSPHLLANYYNNALRHVNYKYAVKIDADQIYFTEKFIKLRHDILHGVSQSSISRFMGRTIFQVFALRSRSRIIWSRLSPLHYLQYILVPLLKRPYYKYAISEFIQGKAYLAISGVNALKINNKWYSPLGCKTKYGIRDAYNGTNDHLIFKTTENTYYIPFDMPTYISNDGRKTYIERFVYPSRPLLNVGLIWFHLKAMRPLCYSLFIDYYKEHAKDVVEISELRHMSYGQMLSYGYTSDYVKYYCRFVHLFDKNIINNNGNILKTIRISHE